MCVLGHRLLMCMLAAVVLGCIDPLNCVLAARSSRDDSMHTPSSGSAQAEPDDSMHSPSSGSAQAEPDDSMHTPSSGSAQAEPDDSVHTPSSGSAQVEPDDSVHVLQGDAVQAPPRWFYTGKEYGTEALYNPISLMLNGSYDIIQLAGNSRQIARYPYARAAGDLWRNIRDPFAVISRFGWGNFLRTEVLPLEWRKSRAQWWPNYQLHLVGGGISYAAIREWYEFHGIAAPTAWAIGTMTAYHVLNEVMENGPYETVDPISDLYIFDAAGIVLFSFDNVREFFSGTLNAADWSLQPSFSFDPLSLDNNGQYFSFKWKLPFSERLHLFYLTGLNGLIGLSVKDGEGYAWSAGVGLRAERLVHLPDANARTAELVWTAGVFYDRNNSLLASLIVTGYTANVATLNVYPGLLRVGGISPGFWLSATRSGHLLGGITTRWVPGVAWR